MPTPQDARRRTACRLLAAGLLATLASACATPAPVTQVGLNRDTPEATYEYFKTVARSNQWAAEWSVFSPNFKRKLNQEVGRVVDVSDYVTARQTIATNSQADMQLLLASSFGGVRMLGPDEAMLTVSAGGRSITPRLRRLTRWELKIRGVDEPAGEFISNPGDTVAVNTDGSITVTVRTDPSAAAYLRTIPRNQIESFAIRSQWYVDDFGGLEAAVGSSAEQPARPGATPPGGTPPSTMPPPGGTMGSGSPDG